jgi:hypothetical protein
VSMISVTRALAQVKSLTDRIQRGTQAQFIAVSVGKKVAGHNSEAEAGVFIKANLQTVRDQIALRAKLKTAIVKSNAATQVEIAGQIMTVAEAIERKSSIELEKDLLNSLMTQRTTAHAAVERLSTELTRRTDEHLDKLYGRDRKTDDEDVRVVNDALEAKSKPALLDENKIDDVIAKLAESLSAFTLEVDYALSEINAVTKIEVA